MTSDQIEHQRHLTKLLLDAIGADDFALAGSGAIREHGLTERPTQDIDLFGTSATTADEFAAALTRRRGARADRLQGHPGRSAPLFARLIVEDSSGNALAVDLGVDWRQLPPVQLDVGPVLSLSDAVASKVSAVYSRGEDRDFLDLDAIRQSGQFTDDELLRLAHEHDGGFDVAAFVHLLRGVAELVPERTAAYGVDASSLGRIKDRLTGWADQLQHMNDDPPTNPQS